MYRCLGEVHIWRRWDVLRVVLHLLRAKAKPFEVGHRGGGAIQTRSAYRQGWILTGEMHELAAAMQAARVKPIEGTGGVKKAAPFTRKDWRFDRYARYAAFGKNRAKKTAAGTREARKQREETQANPRRASKMENRRENPPGSGQPRGGVRP